MTRQLSGYKPALTNDISLLRHATWNLRVGGGVDLLCLEGKVWVTLEGDPNDYLLVRGERLTVERPGLMVVQALTSATLRVRRNELLPLTA